MGGPGGALGTLFTGGISNLVGAAGGVSGITNALGLTSSFNATQAALTNPTSASQLSQNYGQSQTGLAQQQSFVNALQGQNGIGNQSQVYNQLQGVANGTGPNPAQAALAQSTGANTANQAALMAGQRGSGANAGLIARQAAQQGGALQQQAAGQGATLQAQQSLNAMQQAGGIAGQQVGQQAGALQGYNTAAQNEQQNLLNANTGYNNALVAGQSNQNTTNAGTAQANASTTSGLLGGAMSGIGSIIGAAHGGMIPDKQRYADGGLTQIPLAPLIPSGNDSTMQGSMPNSQLSPALTPSAAPVASAGPQSTLGKFIKGAQAGGPGADNAPPPTTAGAALQQGLSNLGKGIAKSMNSDDNTGETAQTQANAAQVDSDLDNEADIYQATNQGGTQMTGGAADVGDMPDYAAKGGLMQAHYDQGGGIASMLPMLAMLAAKGGQVPAMVSPGERYLPPSEVNQVARGKKNPMAAGELIPGQAKVRGDSLKNDTVSKTLESGGIVLPRSVTNSANAPQKSAEFVAAVLRKKGKKI